MRTLGCACVVARFLDRVCRPTSIESKQSLEPIERLLHKAKSRSGSSPDAWHAKRQKIAVVVADNPRDKVAAWTNPNERFAAVLESTRRIRSVARGKARERRHPCAGETD